ncbi:thiolase-like protein, partial [Bimuria novae-zelandiae CBS 107.79]
SLTIRTGCSSSMIALNEACMAIAKGDCKAAIVGGTSLLLSPSTLASLSEQGILSPDGSSNTFSSNANGYARGEAIVAIYVKSLDSAVRDGNPIRAIVSGTATNFNGKTPTMSMPSALAQEAVIRQAYNIAGISEIERTGMFECHGTGTAAGDPIEADAIAAVFGDHGIHISSIKPNESENQSFAALWTSAFQHTPTIRRGKFFFDRRWNWR